MQNWLLHHDSAFYTALCVQQFLARNMAVVAHPHVYPDLDPCDFSHLPKIKINWKNKDLRTLRRITGGAEQQP